MKLKNKQTNKFEVMYSEQNLYDTDEIILTGRLTNANIQYSNKQPFLLVKKKEGKKRRRVRRRRESRKRRKKKSNPKLVYYREIIKRH